jgi:pyridoxine 5-phosphate synthase
MVKLSVNVNKIATLRNSRGGKWPSVLEAVRVCIEAGAPGITVHPRADERHITRADVCEIAALLRARPEAIEFNIEGDPRPELLELVRAVRPTQCTLVPVKPGEITSQAGWPADTPLSALQTTVRQLQEAGVRVSLFVDPVPEAIKWAAEVGGDRVELYTEPYARAWHQGRETADASFRRYAEAAEHAYAAHLGVNAGHDLDIENLQLFKQLPHLAEVSIGHALISHALYVGLEKAVRDFRAALEPER